MEELCIKSVVGVCQMEELPQADQDLLEIAIQSTERSYAPYSRFHVGAAIRLKDGTILPGCNQENAAFPAGLCAERSAIFAAGAQYPDQPVSAIAIAARGTDGKLTEEPVSPCGTCRQVMIETEIRFNQPIHVLLYGRKNIYVVEGVRTLMPLSFTEF